MREYFMKTERTGFSRWTEGDLELARLLWGDPETTRYICASGVFTEGDIVARLEKEIENGKRYGVQYWPIFELSTGKLIGCCGLRPYDLDDNIYEIGFHLRGAFQGKGFAPEAANAVISLAKTTLRAKSLFAGHNPKNIVSAKVLAKLGFSYTGDEFYAPTGLYHPSYLLATQ